MKPTTLSFISLVITLSCFASEGKKINELNERKTKLCKNPTSSSPSPPPPPPSPSPLVFSSSPSRSVRVSAAIYVVFDGRSVQFWKWFF